MSASWCRRPGSRGTRSPLGRPNGYALLAVLWICAGIVALAGALSLAAREASGASRNRIALMRAEWLAAGCVERGRVALDHALVEERRRTGAPDAPVWTRVDAFVTEAADGACELTARPSGARLDVNRLDAHQAGRLLRALGLPAGRADSVAAALVDWRDADDTALPGGAESAWYRERHRPPPANRPFRDPSELRAVRGVEAVDALLDHVTVEPGPVAINHAGEAVLASLPGFTPTSAAAVLAARARGRWIRDVTDLEAEISAADRHALDIGFPELVARATFRPAAWTLQAVAASGDPPVSLVLEVELLQQMDRAAVAARRMRHR